LATDLSGVAAGKPLLHSTPLHYTKRKEEHLESRGRREHSRSFFKKTRKGVSQERK
jgi:hypothetical protein